MSDDTELSVLTLTSREYEALLIVDALKERGIHAEKSGGPADDFQVGVPGQVKVLVESAQREQAMAAFDAIREEAEHIDWSHVDVGDPEE